MTFQFQYGEVVQYEHPKFGIGKGAIAGCNEDQTQWIIYPKHKFNMPDYPFTCFLCKPEQLTSTPF